MKKNYTFITLLYAIVSFAQIPSGYYNSATGSGYLLKTQLKRIINNLNDGLSPEFISLDQGYNGLYTTYLTSDIDLYYENNGTMLDMYTENPSGSDLCEYTYGINQDDGTGGTAECQKYNREHIIPQSVFGSTTPMQSDAHFVVPSDKYVNAQRGNLPFGVVQTPNNTYSNGSKRGNNLNSGYSAGYSGQVFEPINEFKGDIARMYFYFITRYEDDVASWNYDMFNNTSDQVLTNTFLNILLKWHLDDPVSQREIDRNNAIYNRQNNRNPFIDRPEFVCQIYPTQCAALSANSFDMAAISVYPNPSSNGTFTINSSIELTKISVYNVNGQIVKEFSNPSNVNNTYQVSELATGFYFLQLASDSKKEIRKVIVN